MQRSPRPRRPAALAGTVVATGVVAAGAAVVGAPDLFGLAGSRPFVWSVPFRLATAAGLGGLAALAGLAGLRWRRALPPALALAVVAAGSLATTGVRGLSAGELPPARAGDVTVLAANVLHGQADPAALTRLVVDGGADVVSLPESDLALAEDLAARVEAATGTPVQVFHLRDRGRSRFGTALLVSARLGEYRATGELTDGVKAVVTAAPVSGTGPVLAAAHTAAPVPDLLEPWAVEVRAVADWCAATPGAIVAGDLNATLDHPGLRLRGSCVDAGAQTGTGARGTWPARVPAPLGATIDHALADGNAWRAVGSRVEDVPGSDHRALLSRWRPVT
ncbi:endonuclease/exonuclease/phosphatase (EEP) superfamily protein YafD [Kineococcus radiotolerans]|uniref:Endonuclease/exonuclease/phosphatase (EEP) superfamily protein YafD n=1 Tax=Kineococcus radiotolerans TaxID=131568 RepID=A0A7W4TL71_KINRA|nr:endonuclease/exonuclease/phosphatase family protein [Kineococcus radiotolerans]MBB2900950.1 endonuclease/exonuclease/phosphatase (EEP) superfamily protein YafD [Kineococcus radiotolerans]